MIYFEALRWIRCRGLARCLRFRRSGSAVLLALLCGVFSFHALASRHEGHSPGSEMIEVRPIEEPPPQESPRREPPAHEPRHEPPPDDPPRGESSPEHRGDAPREVEGWCCIRGDVVHAPEHACYQERGAFFPDPESAHQHCETEMQPHEPEPEHRGESHHENQGWCCLNGEVFPTPEPVCYEERGAFFPRPELAEQECGFAERPDEHRGDIPHANEGWCCLHGEVFPVPEPVCYEERGAFFPSPELAEQECEFAMQPPEPLLVKEVFPIPTGPPRVVAPPLTGPIPRDKGTKFQRAYRWKRMGGPLGGLGYDVRMTTETERVMYVSDSWAGVFKSNDAGANWFPVNKGISAYKGRTDDAIPIFSLTVDPHKADILWVGTKDQVGIFKSTNGGQSWTKLVNGVQEKELTIRGFTVDPKKSDTVYMAAEVPSYVWDKGKKHVGKKFDMTRGVVYRTTNGGKSWKRIWDGDNLARYVWIDPRDSDVIYIATGIFDREAKNTRLASAHPGLAEDDPGGVGIVKTINGGKTWNPSNKGLGNLYVGSMFMHPKNPDILLVGTGSIPWDEGAGVYLSLNGGKSWEHTLKGDFITAVEFASDPRIAYAGSKNTIYRSDDTGRTWKPMTTTKWYWGAPGVRAGWPIDFQVDPKKPNRVFANNYGGGNFLSTNGGRDWVVASKGYTGAQIRDLAVDPGDGKRVIAVARSGIFESKNSGEDWKGLNTEPAISLDWPAVAIDPDRTQHVLASSLWYPGRLFEKQSAGSKWVEQATINSFDYGWRTIAFAPSKSSRVYAGTGGVASFGQFQNDLKGKGIYFSDDGGNNWKPTPGTGSPTSPFKDAHVVQLAVHPQEQQVVYAATLNHGVLRTRNGGKSWETRNHKLPAAAQVLSVALNPKDPLQIYAGLEKGGMYRSLDAGLNWDAWMPRIDPGAAISDIIFDPMQPEVMYVSDLESGVYRFDPDSQVFVQINIGLENREVNTLAISNDGRTVYAGTEGAGVFRLDVPGP